MGPVAAGYGWSQILTPLQLTVKPVLQLGKLRPREKALIHFPPMQHSFPEQSLVPWYINRNKNLSSDIGRVVG